MKVPESCFTEGISLKVWNTSTRRATRWIRREFQCSSIPVSVSPLPSLIRIHSSQLRYLPFVDLTVLDRQEIIA